MHAPSDPAPDPDRFIVAYEPGFDVAAAIDASGGKLRSRFGRSALASARLSGSAVEALRRDPRVLHVEPDLPRFTRKLSLIETTGYGFTAVQADLVDDGAIANRTLCIIDTGYHLGHLDLPAGANVTGESLVPGTLWSEDYIGHGTHVAGIVPAA